MGWPSVLVAAVSLPNVGFLHCRWVHPMSKSLSEETRLRRVIAKMGFAQNIDFGIGGGVLQCQIPAFGRVIAKISALAQRIESWQ